MIHSDIANALTYTPGYMPYSLLTPIYSGQDSAYKTADEYALLYSLFSTTVQLSPKELAYFEAGRKAIFSHKYMARNDYNKPIIDHWISQNIKPDFQQRAKELLSNPLAFSQMYAQRSWSLVDMIKI